MILKMFLASVVLIALVLLAFGVKLLFNKNAALPQSSCQAGKGMGENISCGCGGGSCENKVD